jgi:heme/copper-type cytochrome/quinol oxidase subunit 3
MTHSDAGGEQDKENQDYLEQQLINEINDLSDQITTANSRGETEKKLSRLASARALAISSSELAETSHKIQKISNQTAIAVGIITGIAAVVAVGLQYLEYNLIKQTQDLENKVQVSEEQRK